MVTTCSTEPTEHLYLLANKVDKKTDFVPKSH